MQMHPPTIPNAFFGARHVQVLIIMLGFTCAYMQKLVLGIGMVAMADPTASSDFYPVIDYSTSEKGILSSMYFYGFLVSSIPSGWVANKYGPAKVFAIAGGFLGGLITSLSPVLTIFLGFKAFCVARVLLGVAHGCLFPCISAFIGKWVVPLEREKFSWVYSGSAIASILVNPLGGLLAISPGGWPSVFYCPGLLSVIWSISCLIFVRETPARHKSITAQEREFIEYYNGNKTNALYEQKPSIPWISIILSVPVWALVLSFAGIRWLDGFAMNFIPSFLKGVYGAAVETNGFLSVLPNVVQVLCSFLFSYLGSLMRARVSNNVSRKFWGLVGCLGPSICFLICAFVEIDLVAAIMLFTLAIGLQGADANSLACNSLDLSRNYSGIIFGFVGTVSIIGSILSTSLMGNIVSNEHDLSEWQTVFLYCGLMSALSTIAFVGFGSTSLQPWDDVNRHEK